MQAHQLRAALHDSLPGSRALFLRGRSIGCRSPLEALALQRLDDTEHITLWIEELTNFDALAGHLLGLSYYGAAKRGGLLNVCLGIVNLGVQAHSWLVVSVLSLVQTAVNTELAFLGAG